MNRTSHSIVALAAAFGLGLANAAHAQTAYVLSNNSALFSFNLATPGTTNFIGSLSGAATSLSDIDFRVSNGLLYGYNQPTNQIVTINTANAVTTFVSNPSTPSNNGFTGIDFNPVADRLRVVNLNDQNLRVNVDNGTTIVDTPLAYAAGDVNFGRNPFIRDVAYTNNDNDPNTATTLYYFDSGSGSLATTSDPNGGVLNTVVRANFGPTAGFDIFTSAGGANTAYVIEINTFNGVGEFYRINLPNAAITFVGNINVSNPTGFAIAPVAASAVPEPGSVALLVGLGVAGAGFVRKRRSLR